MVNLISAAHRSKLKLLYVSKLVTLVGIALGSVGVAVSVLLLPSYLLIHAELDQAAEYVDAARAIASERAKGQSPETLQRFQESVTLLTAAGRSPQTARVLESTTQDMPKGVTISEITLTYDDAGGARVAIAGAARTRAELIAYSNQLKRTPRLTQVTVPVSDLVADVNSTFTVTLEWKP
jgi:Tfp pilus assembly protein PilN